VGTIGIGIGIEHADNDRDDKEEYGWRYELSWEHLETPFVLNAKTAVQKSNRAIAMKLNVLRDVSTCAYPLVGLETLPLAGMGNYVVAATLPLGARIHHDARRRPGFHDRRDVIWGIEDGTWPAERRPEVRLRYESVSAQFVTPLMDPNPSDVTTGASV
jgi:hypothetical protein